MIGPAIETESASIVMIGAFNPSIFQPRWLATQALIRPEEAETAEIRTIQAEAADFSTEWFHLQVLQHRLQIICSDPRHYSPLRDLATGMFVILPHTPIEAIGLNRHFHMAKLSRDAWHNVGHVLAPKETWNEIIKSPGLLSLTMQGQTDDVPGATLNIKVEPSKKSDPGIFVEVNAEFRRGKEADTIGAQWVPTRISEYWDPLMRYTDVVLQHIANLAKDPC